MPTARLPWAVLFLVLFYPRCILRGDTWRCAPATICFASTSIFGPLARGLVCLTMDATSSGVKLLMAACSLFR
jgi:hypothetical protein